MPNKIPPFSVVIPARYASTRLPGKPLLDIAGKPMLQHVYESALSSGARQVVIATDDKRIQDACEDFGAQVSMTREDHQSGTDRVAEVATMLEWVDSEIVVNVQGDEPLLPPQAILQVANLLYVQQDAGVATLCTPVQSLDEFLNPDVVKVLVDKSGKAIFFTRAPVPWNRDAVVQGAQTGFKGANRHIGMYAYRVASLKTISSAAPCAWEELERLEQLRALWLGISIRIEHAVEVPAAGVDNAADLEEVRRILT